MFQLMAQARAGLPLTPSQRAALKLVQGFIIAGMVAAATAISQALPMLGATGPSNAAMDWRSVALTGGVALVVGALHAVSKYYTAQGDTAIVPLVDAVAGKVATLAPNDTKTPGDPPAAPAPVAPAP